MNVLLNSMVNLLSISTSRCPVLGPLLLSMLKEVDQQRTGGVLFTNKIACYQSLLRGLVSFLVVFFFKRMPKKYNALLDNHI